MVLIRNISQNYSIQDTIINFQEEGRAFLCKAFWCTVYNSTNNNNSSYKTCLLVTAVDLTLEETIIDWNYIPQKIHIANQPCNSGKF